MNLIINIPTINDELNDFDHLFKLWHQLNQNYIEVTFDFSQCRFLRPNAVAFLGGLIRLIESRQGKVTINTNTLHPYVRVNLQQNGFLRIFCDDKEPWMGNSVPYREDKEQTKDTLVDYLKEEWLGRDWVHIGQQLQNLIVSTVWEIYANAFEHGKTDIGVFTCGQRYPNLNELKLTVVDFGVGIPHNVRDFLQQTNLATDKALKWAFQPGTTTRQSEVTGGIGLDWLKSFVKKNQGKLEIFSHDGYVMINENQENYRMRETFFEGTLVNITLKCDESYYSLDSLLSEAEDEPLF